MVKLERIYLMNVIFQLETLDDFIKFIQISKDCHEAFQMMHINPNFSSQTQQKELKIFKECKSLQTVFGHLDNIKGFECNLNAIYYLPDKDPYSPYNMDLFVVLNKCSPRITKLKLVINNRNDVIIHWSTYNCLQELIIDFYSDTWDYFNYKHELNRFFTENLHFEELKDLPALKRICIKSVSFCSEPPFLGNLLESKDIISVANKKKKIYLYGNSLELSSANDNIIVMTNYLAKDPKIITSFSSACRVDNYHYQMFIRDWKKYYPMKALFYDSIKVSDISMVDSLVEVELGTCGPGYRYILPKNVKKIKLVGSTDTIDISLCHDLELNVVDPNIEIIPSRKEVKSLIINCSNLKDESLLILTEFPSLKTLVLNDYNDSMLLPSLPNMKVTKNTVTKIQMEKKSCIII